MYRPFAVAPRGFWDNVCKTPFAVARSALIILGAALASLFVGGAGAVDSSYSSSACPRLAEAASLPLRPGGSPLRADVDGDGRFDSVTVRYAPRARASCGFLLVVRTASSVLAIRVPEWYKPPQDLPIRDWPNSEPYLAAVVKLGARGSQIVVARSHGASVANVSLYGLAGGKLAQVGFHPGVPEDQLSLFGTAGTGSTYARCARGGPLFVVSIWPTYSSGKPWAAERREYRLTGGRLLLTRTRTVKGSERRIETLASRWGTRAAPFTGCVVARGRRL